jgi:uncharacterized membrane protein YvbJ
LQWSRLLFFALGSNKPACGRQAGSARHQEGKMDKEKKHRTKKHMPKKSFVMVFSRFFLCHFI